MERQDEVADSGALLSWCPIFTKPDLPFVAALMVILAVLGRTSYPAFHSLTVGASVIVAFTVFFLAWNSRGFVEDDFLLVLGVGLAASGCLDFAHSLTYKGVGIFPEAGGGAPVELWIAARYLEAFTFMLAPLAQGRRASAATLWGPPLGYCALSFAAIGLGWFPACWVEGQGLTPFKVVSEYLICALLVLAFLRLRRSPGLSERVALFLRCALLFKVASELCFTLYVDVYAPANFLGHVLKILSVFAIYRAIVAEGLMHPYDQLFRALRARERSLEESHGELERRVQARTAELEAAQHTLAQAQKLEAIGSLAGGVAHDFNNLLAVAVGHAELLLDDLEPDDPRREDVQGILTACDRGQALTGQLLAFSRQRPHSPKVVDLGTRVRELQKMLRRLVTEDIRLEFEVGPGEHPVLLDPSHVDQVLLNLVVNARDAVSEGGEIRVSVGRRTLDEPEVGTDLPTGEYATLTVSDDGSGIPPEVLSRVFDPFFTTKPVGQGTGMGLSTVHGVARQNRGGITLRSEVGAGTTAEVFFPLLAVSPEASLASEAPAAPTAQREATILLAEDDPDLRAVTSRILERLGYRVLATADGLEALELLEEREVDLVLSDVVMPRLGGSALARQLGESHPSLPVLLMSGYTEPIEQDEETLVLAKPFTSAELRTMVAEALGRR